MFYPIPNYIGFFINQYGDVIDYSGVFLPQTIDAGGYPKVSMFSGDRAYIHRLMLQTFKPEGFFVGSVTRHLDGCPCNNHLYNIAWGTQKENMEDRELHGKTCRGEKNKASKLKIADIEYIRSTLKPRKEIARELDISLGQISKIINKKKWNFI